MISNQRKSLVKERIMQETEKIGGIGSNCIIISESIYCSLETLAMIADYSWRA